MKFIFADSLDYVDPRYDFLEDRSPSDREHYWDDQFPHEILGYAPYDGILVSRAVIGGHQFPGKYSESQAMRFRRVGAREFLRFKEENYPGSLVFGDSGAFAYHKMSEPPYTSEDMVDFYGDGQFSHGCSVDHIIFDFHVFDSSQEAAYEPSEEAAENRRRFRITLDNAAEFLKESQRLRKHFTPMGVVQGWSPLSMAKAAAELVQMGYDYLALGGLAPLRSPQIHKVLDAIADEIGNSARIHILGFAKAEQFSEFQRHKISSFDTTSPLIRAFKDKDNNYYLRNQEGGLDYYAAIRVPQAIQNNKLKALSNEGVYRQEDLQAREKTALSTLRAYDCGEANLDEALEAVMAYATPILIGKEDGHSASDIKKLNTMRERMHRTLAARPWKQCDCAICRDVSVEVMIFRASNRNKRRGIHNLAVYGKHIKDLQGSMADGTYADFSSDQGAAE